MNETGPARQPFSGRAFARVLFYKKLINVYFELMADG